MKVDYVLILAAGKGTRMGEIGESIPKVLWPVFGKSILELEVLFSQKYCKNQTYINLYNYSDKILSFAKDSNILDSISFLIEKEKLDIGGAIHNLAKQVNYTGKVLVINSDQFIMLSEKKWKEVYELSEKKDAVILSYDVLGRDLYNGVESSSGKLVEIRKNNKYTRSEKMETYTGMSIINLESLTPSEGESTFFDTVADYKKLDVGVVNIANSKYWDFGTIRRYYNSMFAILKNWNGNDPFIGLLKKHSILNMELVKDNSYNSNTKFVIDLFQNTDHQEKTIYLGPYKQQVPKEDCIVFEDSKDMVDLPSL